MVTTQALAEEIQALLGDGKVKLSPEDRAKFQTVMDDLARRRLDKLSDRMEREKRRAEEVARETRAQEEMIQAIRASCTHRKASIPGGPPESMLRLRSENGRLFGFCGMMHGSYMCGQPFAYPTQKEGELPITPDLMPSADEICTVSGPLEGLHMPAQPAEQGVAAAESAEAPARITVARA